MGYFDTQKHVDEYIELAKGYDGRELIDVLVGHLPKGSSVLELGMGPGKDLDMLAEIFHVVGSDNSAIFVDRYQDIHPEADVLRLDAITLDTERTFDALYSNKVLHQLTKTELEVSLRAQHQILNRKGIALHSLWYGEQCEVYGEMIAQHYTLESFLPLLGEYFEIIDHAQYSEMDEKDSLYIVIQKK